MSTQAKGTNPKQRIPCLTLIFAAARFLVLFLTPAYADGVMVKPAKYKGVVEESAQEAIIVFQGSQTPGAATGLDSRN